jgi:hypothetical protein
MSTWRSFWPLILLGGASLFFAGWFLGKAGADRIVSHSTRPLHPPEGPAAPLVPETPPPSWNEARAISREWKVLDFGTIDTPWGQVMVQAQPDGAGFRFDMIFSGPGTSDDAAWKTFKPPADGEIQAELWCDGASVRATNNGVPKLHGWFGGSLGTSGSMMMGFDPLPDDLKDYWVRARVRARTFWFLIPYGLSGRGVPGQSSVDEGAPRPPKGLASGDLVVLWKKVSFDLGKLSGDRWASLELSNSFDASGTITIYRDPFNVWSLDSPRTGFTVAVHGRTRVESTLRSMVWSEDRLRRHDTYDLWRNSGDNRIWGVVRVTVEEKTFERLVPSSLFGYCHGRIGD